jgi:hypothetical protein
MRHTGIKIFLLLLFLVMILCAIIIIRDPTVWPFGKEGQGISLPFIRQTQSTPTPAPAPEKTPESAAGSVQQPAAEKPAATAKPAPATPQPTPTPTPAPTPEPYGKVLSSGTISSGKPWLINIHADWVATTSSESQAEVEVVAYADHFALTYGSTESLHITLGEKSVLLSANAIDSKINDKSQATELGRKTFTVPLKAGESVSLPLEVSWDFEGMYVDNAGNYFDVHGITSEGTVSINR